MKQIFSWPLLWTGRDDKAYKEFCRRLHLQPYKQVRWVRKMDDVRGYKDKVWYIDYGYWYLFKDSDAMSYANQHNIKVFKADGQGLYLFADYLIKMFDK